MTNILRTIMRIIDKNNDYYDYLQDPTDDLVFDRRGSFVLTKEMIREALNVSIDYRRCIEFGLILLQCGATFWLLLTTPVYTTRNNYDLKLLNTWKNYDKPNRLLATNIINCRNFRYYCPWDGFRYTTDNIIKNTKYIVDRINQNNFKVDYDLSANTCYIGDKKIIKTIPLLKSCGIPKVIDASSIFWAIEEYFSIEKSKLETTEAKGTTNNDKIEMYGFDVKTSFRGKQ